MKRIIKKITPSFLLELRREHINRRLVDEWVKKGKPVPQPHLIKQLVIENYQKKYDIAVLIETGTYMGDMIKAQLKNFDTLYSIELDLDLWGKAVERFKKYNHVKIIQGDSGKVLKDLIPEINKKAIFWLDGHFSGGITAKGDKDCPIYNELDAIFNSKIQHIILIDDARCFNGKGDYPTIEKLSEYILSKFSSSKIEIKDDIIRVELL